MSPETAAPAVEATRITNTMFGVAPTIPEQAPPHTVAVTIIKPGLSKALLGEVHSLDNFDEAMALLKREHPEREAFRVTIRH